MAGRSAYTEADRARVYAVLLANKGNVKRTARETGYPENTVRRWKTQFTDSPPAADILAEVADDLVSDMDRVRRLALNEMEKKIREGGAKLGELNTIYGTLTDKINLLTNIGQERNINHTLQLPSAEDIKAALLPAIQAGIEAAEQRQADVLDTVVVEVTELPEHLELPATV